MCAVWKQKHNIFIKSCNVAILCKNTILFILPIIKKIILSSFKFVENLTIEIFLNYNLFLYVTFLSKFQLNPNNSHKKFALTGVSTSIEIEILDSLEPDKKQLLIIKYSRFKKSFNKINCVKLRLEKCHHVKLTRNARGNVDFTWNIKCTFVDVLLYFTTKKETGDFQKMKRFSCQKLKSQLVVSKNR